MNMHFDTLAAVKRIEAAGLDRAKAEAVVNEIVAAQSELADKSDIAILNDKITAIAADLKAQITTGDSGLKTEIANAKVETIRWLFGSQVFLIVALVALTQFTKLL